ncbi:MAG TPA: hypothetical protein VFP65_19865, partial [Anaeromyxobacteraceae bacterium]|nr:hypothetical protein [Anaeromyxobacteraceae bacterium]
MAYLPASQWKRQQQAQAPVAAPESSGPGGGAPTSAAPSSAPTTPSVDTGSGWTNLQDYLSANQAPLAAEAQHVSQEVTPKAQQAIAPQDIKSTGPMVPWLSDSSGRV